jgi:hypothetical protein
MQSRSSVSSFPRPMSSTSRRRCLRASESRVAVVVYRQDGQIRDSDTIAAGNDPDPPRDTK